MVAHIRNNHRHNNLLFVGSFVVDSQGFVESGCTEGSQRVNRVEIVLDEQAVGLVSWNREGEGGRG